MQKFQEAENAARRVMEMFPGAEPAYHELASAMVGTKTAPKGAYVFLN